MKKKILYSLLASNKIGYGHLIRSSAIAKKFRELGFKNILFGPHKSQLKYINKKIYNKYIPLKFNSKKITSEIINLYKKHNCIYLVLDIPFFSEENEKMMHKKKIKWLQFDCKRPYLTFSNQKICSLPKNIKSKKKNLYVGNNNVILREEFYKKKKNKTLKNNIFISFGGGNDNGALYFLLKNFYTLLKKYNLNILLGNNKYRTKIFKILKDNFNIKKINFVKKDVNSIIKYIDKSLFSINSGGTISHEIFSRSKKMVIISIVKNQICQSNIWHKNGHIYLGDISDKKNLQKNFVKNLNKIKDIKKLKFKLKKNPVTNICKDAIKIIKKS